MSLSEGPQGEVDTQGETSGFKIKEKILNFETQGAEAQAKPRAWC